MTTDALTIRGLHKRFRSLRVITGLDLTVAQGERHVIFGPNGAGKTTLFNVISGQIRQEQGTIQLFGEPLDRVPVFRRARRGVVRTQQVSSVFRELTLRENLELALQAQTAHSTAFLPRRGEGTLSETVNEVLEEWSWGGRGDTVVGTLAYGEQRRVELATALLQKPRLLLLDEPMAGLTEQESDRIAETIAALDRSISVLLIEHHVSIALQIADRVSVMHQGTMVASGTPEQISDDELVREVYLGTSAGHEGRN
ncbi:MAG: branched-chain amino acid transporter substrate-binding protein [Naasia sp.]|jgi:branched-chain amino acid transport system ATP-binding protein|nr:branched-chain amino acid transporter substrate-binding protein [Naasia sp.]